MPSTPLISSTKYPNRQKSKDLPIVAFAGVPNCGKTTLFNAVTGLNYKVANYPGVTVERKEGKAQLPDIGTVSFVDLPGAYSLLGGSPDEIVAADYLSGLQEHHLPPDLIICVLDACNLERNLYLASQIIDLGIPTLIFLSMNDLAVKQGLIVNKDLLSKRLGVPVVDAPGRSKDNIDLIQGQITKTLKHLTASQDRFQWVDVAEYLSAANKLADEFLKYCKHPQRTIDKTSLGMSLLTGIRRPTNPELNALIIETRTFLREKGIDAGTYECELRYRFISSLIKDCISFTETDYKSITPTIDRFVTHKFWGAIVFLSVMAFMFHAVFSWAELPMELIDSAFVNLQQLMLNSLPEGSLRDLIVHGIIAGAGSVIIFVPQIAILYLFISILEESGYLSRAAFMMDSLMRKFGLQGRSFIPLLSSFACAVPGIMSTRSIPSWTDRMTTILVAPLMSCSARLPVYTLLIAAFVPTTLVWGFFSMQGLVLLAMYLLGTLGAAFVAFCLKRTIFRGAPTHFVMEMPPYRIPRLTCVIRTIIDRVWLFIKTAGTVIIAMSIILWFLASYPKLPTSTPSETLENSYAGRIGHSLSPILEPLGFDWRIGISIVSSLAAREVFVSSMSVVYNLEHDSSSESLALAIKEAKDLKTGKPRYTILTAITLMVFYVFSCQCISTLAVCKRETGSWKWTLFLFTYMTLLAYGASFATFKLGSMLL